MAVRTIRIWPDPALAEVARPVKEVTNEVKSLIDDLFETLYKANGVGLAATQIGVGLRVLVIDLDPNNSSKDDAESQTEFADWGYTGPLAFVNPEIVEASGKLLWEEGCLSVPGEVGTVERKHTVTVKALDRNGKEFKLTAKGLFAVAVQHETDHLNGTVFVDHLSKLKRDVIRRKMQRLKSEHGEDAQKVAEAL